MTPCAVHNETPPGWYPDPSTPDLDRWWDGGRWSGVTRQSGEVTASSPSSPRTSQPPQPHLPVRPADRAAGASAYQAGPSSYPAGAPALTTPDGVPLAGLGARLGARVLDFLITSMITSVVAFPWISSMGGVVQRWVDEVTTAGSGGGVDILILLEDPEFISATQTVGWISLAVSAVYVIGFIAWRGATPGKMATGVRVRRWDREGLPTGTQAMLRWATREGITVIPGIGTIYLFVDSIWPLWDPRRQALHDKAPGTVVVRTR